MTPVERHLPHIRPNPYLSPRGNPSFPDHYHPDICLERKQSKGKDDTKSRNVGVLKII